MKQGRSQIWASSELKLYDFFICFLCLKMYITWQHESLCYIIFVLRERNYFWSCHVCLHVYDCWCTTLETHVSFLLFRYHLRLMWLCLVSGDWFLKLLNYTKERVLELKACTYVWDYTNVLFVLRRRNQNNK